MEAMVVPFIELHTNHVLFLLAVGFVGGLVSGFIGSGGAFVLTPAMMSMGVGGVVAVASNICHKFPKALVGAYKRYRYGQVDIKLGLVTAAAASLGVWLGADIQNSIRLAWGEAGSNLYVSVAFVVVLYIVGTFVALDVWKTARNGARRSPERAGRLARWVQSVEIPGTMVRFPVAGTRVSVLFILPVGFATGMFAATIAVGGFIGVPGIIYVLGVSSVVASATELVVAFVMGLGGTVKYALHGLVDIRLAMIILAASLFGVQLGAIGTTYVKPYVIKLVMAVIMLIVAFSRCLMIPVYLGQLGHWRLGVGTMRTLETASFALMVFALLVGAAMILGAMARGRRDHRLAARAPEAVAE
jgi:uncharacterized membrane protein YfcA